MKQKKLTIALFSLFSLFSLSSFAASPFLVSHSATDSAVESGGGSEVQPVTTTKSVTLAESLVHLRQCHMSAKLATEQSPVEPIEVGFPAGLEALSP
jgi:hypothetical protein